MHELVLCTFYRNTPSSSAQNSAETLYRVARACFARATVEHRPTGSVVAVAGGDVVDFEGLMLVCPGGGWFCASQPLLAAGVVTLEASPEALLGTCGRSMMLKGALYYAIRQ